jgi:hypothetical protein
MRLLVKRGKREKRIGKRDNREKRIVKEDNYFLMK